jgi:hypothetical protein
MNTSSAMYSLLWGKRRERPRGRDLDRERGSYRERDNRKSNGLKGHHVSSGSTTTGAGMEDQTLMFVNESFTPGGSMFNWNKGKTREQREHAAAVLKLGACPDSKARKVRCSLSHKLSFVPQIMS